MSGKNAEQQALVAKTQAEVLKRINDARQQTVGAAGKVLTKGEMLTTAGLSPQMWGRWENEGDSPTLETLTSIAFAMERRLSVELPRLSAGSDTFDPTTTSLGAPLTDDAIELARMLDALPTHVSRQRVLGKIEQLIQTEAARHPLDPTAESSQANRGRGTT